MDAESKENGVKMDEASNKCERGAAEAPNPGPLRSTSKENINMTCTPPVGSSMTEAQNPAKWLDVPLLFCESDTCNSDEEVFFGKVSAREQRKATKYTRRTAIFTPEFRRNRRLMRYTVAPSDLSSPYGVDSREFKQACHLDSKLVCANISYVDCVSPVSTRIFESEIETVIGEVNGSHNCIEQVDNSACKDSNPGMPVQEGEDKLTQDYRGKTFEHEEYMLALETTGEIVGEENGVSSDTNQLTSEHEEYKVNTVESTGIVITPDSLEREVTINTVEGNDTEINLDQEARKVNPESVDISEYPGKSENSCLIMEKDMSSSCLDSKTKSPQTMPFGDSACHLDMHEVAEALLELSRTPMRESHSVGVSEKAVEENHVPYCSPAEESPVSQTPNPYPATENLACAGHGEDDPLSECLKDDHASELFGESGNQYSHGVVHVVEELTANGKPQENMIHAEDVNVLIHTHVKDVECDSNKLYDELLGLQLPQANNGEVIANKFSETTDMSADSPDAVCLQLMNNVNGTTVNHELNVKRVESFSLKPDCSFGGASETMNSFNVLNLDTDSEITCSTSPGLVSRVDSTTTPTCPMQEDGDNSDADHAARHVMNIILDTVNPAEVPLQGALVRSESRESTPDGISGLTDLSSDSGMISNYSESTQDTSPDRQEEFGEIFELLTRDGVKPEQGLWEEIPVISATNFCLNPPAVGVSSPGVIREQVVPVSKPFTHDEDKSELDTSLSEFLDLEAEYGVHMTQSCCSSNGDDNLQTDLSCLGGGPSHVGMNMLFQSPAYSHLTAVPNYQSPIIACASPGDCVVPSVSPCSSVNSPCLKIPLDHSVVANLTSCFKANDGKESLVPDAPNAEHSQPPVPEVNPVQAVTDISQENDHHLSNGSIEEFSGLEGSNCIDESGHSAFVHCESTNNDSASLKSSIPEQFVKFDTDIIVDSECLQLGEQMSNLQIDRGNASCNHLVTAVPQVDKEVSVETDVNADLTASPGPCSVLPGDIKKDDSCSEVLVVPDTLPKTDCGVDESKEKDGALSEHPHQTPDVMKTSEEESATPGKLIFKETQFSPTLVVQGVSKSSPKLELDLSLVSEAVDSEQPQPAVSDIVCSPVTLFAGEGDGEVLQVVSVTNCPVELLTPNNIKERTKDLSNIGKLSTPRVVSVKSAVGRPKNTPPRITLQKCTTQRTPNSPVKVTPSRIGFGSSLKATTAKSASNTPSKSTPSQSVSCKSSLFKRSTPSQSVVGGKTKVTPKLPGSVERNGTQSKQSTTPKMLPHPKILQVTPKTIKTVHSSTGHLKSNQRVPTPKSTPQKTSNWTNSGTPRKTVPASNRTTPLSQSRETGVKSASSGNTLSNNFRRPVPSGLGASPALSSGSKPGSGLRSRPPRQFASAVRCTTPGKIGLNSPRASPAPKVSPAVTSPFCVGTPVQAPGSLTPGSCASSGSEMSPAPVYRAGTPRFTDRGMADTPWLEDEIMPKFDLEDYDEVDDGISSAGSSPASGSTASPTMADILARKREQLMQLREAKRALQLKLATKRGVRQGTPSPFKSPKPVSRQTTADHLPKVRYKDTQALGLGQRELEAVTNLHTMCNGQRSVKIIQKGHAAVIRHIPVEIPTKEASRLQWSEELVGKEDVHHTPQKAKPSSKPILKERSPEHRYPFNDESPSSVVVCKTRRSSLSNGIRAAKIS